MADSNSRFRMTPVVVFDGAQTYGKWVEPKFMSSKPSPTYIVPNRLARRPDLISQELYGTVEYYWAIIAFNSPRDPLNWPKAGEAIYIPSISEITAEL